MNLNNYISHLMLSGRKLYCLTIGHFDNISFFCPKEFFFKSRIIEVQGDQVFCPRQCF